MKKLKFKWVTQVTTTAGHVSTALMPSDDYTREFVLNKAGLSVMGFCPSYLERRAFANQSIVIRGA
jgi:hypothetical protein